MMAKKPVKKLVKAKEGISTKKGCPRGKCGTYPNCYDCPDNTKVVSPIKKSLDLPTKKDPNRLTKVELDALSHQKRGMGTNTGSYVKQAGSIKNESGQLTPSQKAQLDKYMSQAPLSRKIYEALPNLGRVYGSSAADIPKSSKLKNQKKGGVVKSKKKK
jgi:hypothetical protein